MLFQIQNPRALKMPRSQRDVSQNVKRISVKWLSFPPFFEDFAWFRDIYKLFKHMLIYMYIYNIYMGVFENDAPKEPKSHWNRDHAQPMEQWI